jgi:hypothetical protein
VSRPLADTGISPHEDRQRLVRERCVAPESRHPPDGCGAHTPEDGVYAATLQPAHKVSSEIERLAVERVRAPSDPVQCSGVGCSCEATPRQAVLGRLPDRERRFLTERRNAV